MIERHLLLMAVEVIIFVMILSWCVHQNNGARYRTHLQMSAVPQTLSPKISTVSGSVSMTTLNTPSRFVKGHKRHNSTDVTPNRNKEQPCSNSQLRSQDDSCVTHASGRPLLS